MKEDFRLETDSLGSIKVPIDKFWGAQTQRSIKNFTVGDELIPLDIIYSLTLIKKAAAITNFDLGILESSKKDLIILSCDDILNGMFDDQFPLKIWQTGSGTQTNMNVNEVISNIGALKNGSEIGKNNPLHPNDDVNKCQSTNDTFPAAIQISVAKEINNKLFHSIDKIHESLESKKEAWKSFIKIGRTHFQDAVPITYGQEISAWSYQIKQSKESILKSMEDLYLLPLGGTAVGTGINCPQTFSEKTIRFISKETNLPFKKSDNYFSLMSSHDRLANIMSQLKNLACSLFKISNDIKILSSGPRSGIYELLIPQNEPGSSIMPGKVNPTQCEALSMICAQIMGLDYSVSIANCSGTLQMNEYKPLIGFNILKSINLLSEGINNFRVNLIEGMKPNLKIAKYNLENSLMLVTALVPEIGYEKAAEIAKLAYDETIKLKEAAIKLGYLNEEKFDSLIKPEKMI